jgi:hypothetical protein
MAVKWDMFCEVQTRRLEVRDLHCSLIYGRIFRFTFLNF